MAAPQASSRLEMLQARFQQKQLQEKEQKLLQLYDQQQQRAYQVVQRGSAGSNHGSTSTVRTTTTTHTTSTSQGGKVRQMFDERRQTVKGIDRSYPLEPLENKLRKQTNTNGVTGTQRNGNLTVNRQSVSMKRMARADVNSNVNGGKPVVSYHEEITRDSFGPFTRRHDEEDEFGIENRIATFANGHHRHDIDNEQDEGLDQEAMERNRMMAKIHLMGFDETLKHRVRNDLESEEFPEYLMADVPEKLPKKNITKKLSQAQARLDRFKNTIAKKNSAPKQPISTGTVIKKRSEQMEPARSNSQRNEIAATSPTSMRSGSRTSKRSQRILANVKTPLPAETRVVDRISKRRGKSSDVDTFSRKDSSSKIFLGKVTKTRTYPRNNEFKSLTSDGKIFIRRSPSPQFLCTESERSGTTMSIDRKSTDSRLASPDRMKRSTSPQFFCRENERSATTMSIDRKTDGSKSSEWESEVYGKRSTSPRYFDAVSRQNPRTTSITSSTKSPEWDMRSSSKGSASPQFFSRESERSATAMSIDGSAKSGTIPQYSSKQYERSETSTSIDRKSNLSESPLFYRETSTKRSANPRFFLDEFQQSRRTDKSNLPIWNKEILQRNMNPRYFREFKQTEKNIDTDRKTSEFESLKWNKEMLAKQNMQYFDKKHGQSTIFDRKTTLTKSPLYEKDILKRRSTSPQFFCKESERSGTTMTIDRARSESRSPLYDRKIVTKRSSSPQFFCKESERSGTTMAIDRARSESRSPLYDRKIVTKRSSSPQFFCKESERSATTMSIDRKVNQPKSLSYNQKILTKQSKSPEYFNRKSEQQQYKMTTDINQEYDKSKSTGTTRDKRTTSPQFFCKETEKSATTMLIEPRSSTMDSAKGLKQRNYSNISYKQSTKSVPSVNKKMSSTQSRYISKPLIANREIKRDLKKNEISVTESRRSSKISESSATSASSIVNLKYGLEFDNIFQSAKLVGKFMKSQKGEQRQVRQSPPKRNIKNVSAPTTKDIQSRNRYKTLLLSQKTRSPSKSEIEDQRRTTPESPRKSITPTEVDMEIQEITMTDHRIERDRLQNAASPISNRQKRQIDRIFAKSPNNKMKFKTSITYPVRKTHKQRASILGSSVLTKENSFGKSKRTKDHRSDRDSEESAISLSKLNCSPVSETSHVIIRSKENRVRKSDTKTREQTWDQSIKNRTERIGVRPKKYEDRQRVSSRFPNQMRRRPIEDRLQSSKITSSEFLRREQHSTVSPILCEDQRTRETRAEFDQSRRLQSMRLVQDALKDKDLSSSAIDKHDRQESKDKQENKGVDEVDVGIDTKYQTIVETALNKKMKNRHKIVGPNSADIRSKDIFARKGARVLTKSITQKKQISPRRECGRQHDIKSSASSQALSSRQSPKMSPNISQISVSQRIVLKTDRSSSPKFLTYTVKDGKRKSILDTKETADKIRDKMNIKRVIEKSDNTTKEVSKALMQREDKSDFGRTDSVESALKRFDSIGAEFEHSGPSNFRASPEISLQVMNVQVEISAKGPITSQESTTVDSREVTEDTISKSASKRAIDKDLKNVARKNDLKILGKEIYSSKKIYSSKGLAETERLTGSKQRSTQTRSPACKRQLFRSNIEKGISGDQLKSSRAKARKRENYPSVNVASREREAFSKIRSAKSLDREVTKDSRRLEETPELSVKPLRSIEDIRKSIDNARNKLAAVKESRSAIANRHSTSSRAGIDAKGSVSATDAARNVFSGGDPIKLTKIKSCVSRTTKSPSPDAAARKQHETNATRTTRGNVLSSPSKSPDIASRRVPTDSKNQETKPSRKSTVAKDVDSIGSKAATIAAVDVADGVVLQNGSPHEESPTKKSDAFVTDLDDQPSKESDTVSSRKPPVRKSPSDQTTSRGSGRPISSSSSSANSSHNQSQTSSTKARMATKTSNSSGPQTKKTLPAKSSGSNTDNLVTCRICKRNFAPDRISYHETICTKTTSKKRKQFNTKIFRVRGTELEPFAKEGFDKKQESKTKKSEVKSDWRRKHEEFINTIRYAKQVQAHVATGGNPNDIAPPPPSDTSDYIQCPHCGRKFNQGAAERHIPKCENMRHNKPAHSRAPPRPRR